METAMNRPFALAAVLMGATALLHLIGGEFDVHRPLLARAIAPTDAPFISILWHGVSAMLVLSAVVMALAARNPERHASGVWVAVLWNAALGGLFISYGFVHLGSLFILPQWTLLLAGAALGLWGLARPWATAA
jgi:hypothetical protein